MPEWDALQLIKPSQLEHIQQLTLLTMTTSMLKDMLKMESELIGY